jgi:N6-L-threonylcarbamoyladenine synthase
MRKHGSIKWLGGTRDDAAGEAFDKIGRLLGLPYPGGSAIEKASERGIATHFTFPRPMINSKDFDFSFSGLKSAVFREVKAIKQFSNSTIANLAASVQQAIIDVLISKTLKAVQKYNVKSILLGGGVAANQKLRAEFQSSIINLKSSINFFAPPKNLCTDNGAMIASAAFFNYKPVPWQKLTANPELYFG